MVSLAERLLVVMRDGETVGEIDDPDGRRVVLLRDIAHHRPDPDQCTVAPGSRGPADRDDPRDSRGDGSRTVTRAGLTGDAAAAAEVVQPQRPDEPGLRRLEAWEELRDTDFRSVPGGPRVFRKLPDSSTALVAWHPISWAERRPRTNDASSRTSRRCTTPPCHSRTCGGSSPLGRPRRSARGGPRRKTARTRPWRQCRPFLEQRCLCLRSGSAARSLIVAPAPAPAPAHQVEPMERPPVPRRRTSDWEDFALSPA